MAFRQPTHAPQRQLPLPPRPEAIRTTSYQSSQALRQLEESQEWVLFSPSQAPSTTRTHTTSTSRTPRTAGLSRLSDFGSLDTAARSYDREDEDEREDEEAINEDEDDEGEDLDSLDSHLHAFREPSVYNASSKRRLDQSGGTVLPTHDGLGTFPASSSGVQEQLWAFEQYNPHRKSQRRRRSSKPLDSVDQREMDETSAQNERMKRIEQWRREQSQALLDEIQKETRRRRMTRESDRRSRTASMGQEEMVTLGSKDRKRGLVDGNVADGQNTGPEANAESEGFWTRITRRVIRDLMGIDESLLSVIFGEALADEGSASPVTTLDMDRVLQDEIQDDQPASGGWEDRLLQRIGMELGILVHQLSEHPGAFSTYLRTIQETPEYAGLPASSSKGQAPVDIRQSQGTPTTPSDIHASTSSPFFNPTIPLAQQEPSPAHHAALWGIEEEFPQSIPPSEEAERLAREREHWERELDVKMVFTFLRDRFRSRSAPSSGEAFRSASLSTSPEDTARRAVARVQQHHPLVSQQRAQQQRRRAMHQSQSQHALATSNSNSVSVQRWRRSIALKDTSSCASESTRSLSVSRRSRGSSRHYWDLGGAGSESAVSVVAAGGLGGWGEV